MTTVTLELPDRLAHKLLSDKQHLARLLSIASDLSEVMPSYAITDARARAAYERAVAFLASNPTPSQIILFKAESALQERLEQLLNKRQIQDLTDHEQNELELFENLNSEFGVLKAHAHRDATL